MIRTFVLLSFNSWLSDSSSGRARIWNLVFTDSKHYACPNKLYFIFKVRRNMFLYRNSIIVLQLIYWAKYRIVFVLEIARNKFSLWNKKF